MLSINTPLGSAVLSRLLTLMFPLFVWVVFVLSRLLLCRTAVNTGIIRKRTDSDDDQSKKHRSVVVYTIALARFGARP